MTQPNQIAQQDMFHNKDKSQVLPAGHSEAAFLYVREGDEIPASACERYGIVDGKAPASKGGKSKGAPANKKKNTPENKGGGTPPNETKPLELIDIKGIGPATAGALVTAGVADVAALAKVDPASPPTVETLPPKFDWAAVVKTAKAALEAQGAVQ